jgi:two-component system, cell cycle sensor histidine kinase and response regulator CckA
MPFTPTAESPSQIVGAPLVRDRLRTFRQLSLVFALFALGGTAATLGFLPATTPGDRLETVTTAVLLAAVWVYGYTRNRFAIGWLPIEVVLLIGFVHGVDNPIAVLGICYVGVQYRALYGTRRDAAVIGIAYVLAFVLGLAFMRDSPGVMRPVVLVEVIAIGFCAYLLHTLADVLERDSKRTLELRRSKDRYRLMFEQNPMPMWVVDPHSLRILDVNAVAVQVYGYSREEFLGMTLRDLRAAEDLAAFEQLRPVIESQGRFTYQTRHRKHDGSIIDVEVTADVVEFEGHLARIGLAVDVTGRERTERALRESEQRFRSVAENLREAVIITDTDDRIILANARVSDVLGYDPDEVVGKNASELLLPPAQQNVFRDRLRRRLNGETELYETELIRKDGKRIFAEVSAGPYRDAAGRIIGTLGAVSDISERRRLEDRLHHAMRMEAIGQLAGGVAHDFNNLLTVIKCHTELLLDDLRKGDPTRDGVTEIARAAQRAATVTQQLLAFSRKQFLQPRRLALAAIVAEAVPMLHREVGENVNLVTLADDPDVHVFADPLQLEQVLLTLVRNADEAMPDGGRITIETRALELHEKHLHGSTQEMPGGRYALLTVSDTGVGMTAEVQARLFEPFFTTKGPGEGTGLGLASMYGIVRQSGGYVDVESIPKVGTVFRIYLPLATTGQKEPLPSTELQPA